MGDVKQYPVSLVVKAVDKLTGPLGAMTAKLKAFASPFGNLGRSVEGFGKASGIPRVVSAFGGAAHAIRNVGAETVGLGLRFLALGATGAFALERIVAGAVEAGDDLAKMADRVGLSVDAFAAFRFSAAQADVTQEEFNGAMSKFSKVLGEAKANGGPLLEFLRKVSPVMALQIQNAKTVEEGMSLMTDAFAKLPDVQRRATLSTAAFGRGGQQIGEWMHQGSGAIQGQMMDYLQLAGSQEKFARGSSDLDNQMRRTNAALTGLRAAALSPLLPVFGRLADRVTNFTVTNRGKIADWADRTAGAIESWVSGGGLERLTASFGRFADTVGKVWDFVGGLKGALVGLGLYLGAPLIGSVAALIPAFGELGIALFSTPFGWAAAGALALGAAGAAIYLNWDKVRGFVDENFPGMADDIEEAASAIASLTKAVLAFEATNIKGAIDTLKELKPILDAMNSAALGGEAGVGMIKQVVTAASPLQSLASASRGLGELKVTFGNTPPGTRINVEEPPNYSIDTSVGYANSSH